MADTLPLYEGMFLLNQQMIGTDLDAALAHVREMLDRASAEVVALQKWDESRLAYPIQGQKRGLYIIALFRVAGGQLANIERDCNLSEHVLRAMMLRADHMGDVEIQAVIEGARQTRVEAALHEQDAVAVGVDDITSDE